MRCPAPIAAVSLLVSCLPSGGLGLNSGARGVGPSGDHKKDVPFVVSVSHQHHLLRGGGDQEKQPAAPTVQAPGAQGDHHNLTTAKPQAEEQHIVHPEPAGDWALVHELCAGLVFVAFGASMCVLVPMVRREWEFYTDHLEGTDAQFRDYLGYRFTDWFTMNKQAPSLVLLLLTMGLIVTGAAFYALLVGESPAQALWLIFVWATGSPAQDEITLAGRFLGILVTVCGLIILSLLLGIVTELFASKMQEIKLGLSRVVEGGHVVILGYTDCTRCLLEELANARESEGGGCFVILSTTKKDVVEEALYADYIRLRNSRLIVRSGNPCSLRDLDKVAVSAAKQVIILADTTCAPEQADAKSVRTLLALKTKGWPVKGHITVQCSCEANRELLTGLYQDRVEVVVVGDIIAKLMAQSAAQHGLAAVFGMMLGFEGDEFYAECWDELAGLTFHETVFRFPDAVVLGVFTGGECKLNPGWKYVIQPGDRIIVLAEDNDKYAPVKEPYIECPGPIPSSRAFNFAGRGYQERGDKPSKILIIGWNNKIGPLLAAIDETVAPGSVLTIYSPRPVPYREGEIQKFGRKHQALTIQHLEVEDAKMTSRIELERIQHYEHDSIFILADIELNGRAGADERTVTALTQLQRLELEVPQKDRKKFDPVVEMCEDSTAEHLRLVGLTNFVHSNSLVSQALAAVAEEPSVNAIYAELMSCSSNLFEFRYYSEFLPKGETVPDKLSFGEAAYRISLTGDISLIAWSEGQGNDRVWIVNPKDKVTPRDWTTEDKLVVIRRFRGGLDSFAR